MLACVAFLSWWLLVFASTRHHLHVLSAGSVRARPAWLPWRWLRFLTARARAPFIFAAVPIVFALGVIWPHWALRVLIAAVVALYHLNESSSTGRHGEYPLLYCSCAMALPAEWASALAWGVVIHFVLSSGMAKLQVGGAEWMHPRTMRTYLGLYHASSSRPPLSRRLNRWIAARDWALAAISAATLALEVVFVPATLLMPAPLRPLGWMALVGMHVGIALAMSLQVGLVFVTALPCYVVGFSCAAATGSAAWAVAAIVGLAPTAVALARGSPLPEDWPCSGLALFMFNGSQAQQLGAILMSGDTRLVLTTEGRVAARSTLLGRPIIHHGLADLKQAAAGVPVVHDSVLRTAGFTLLRNAAETLPLLAALRPGATEMKLDVGALATRTSAWLQRHELLIEERSGRPLLSAHFVRVRDGRVVEILA